MDKKIVSFDLMSIKKNSKRICQCKTPKYEFDLKNRMIQCKTCDAYVDPFEALEKISLHRERYVEWENEAIEVINNYREQINKMSKQKFKLAFFKRLHDSYVNSDLIPVCPHCKNGIEPEQMTMSLNKNYIHKKDLKDTHIIITDDNNKVIACIPIHDGEEIVLQKGYKIYKNINPDFTEKDGEALYYEK